MADRQKLTAADLKNIKTANELFQKQLEIEKNLVAQEQKIDALRGRRVSAVEKETQLIDAQIKLAEENLKVALATDEAMKQRIALLEKETETVKGVQKGTAAQREELEKLIQQQDIFTEGGREAFVKLNQELLATSERMGAVRLAGVSINKQFMAMIGNTDKWRSGVIGAFADAAETGGTLTEVLEQVNREFKSTENQMNMLGSTM